LKAKFFKAFPNPSCPWNLLPAFFTRTVTADVGCPKSTEATLTPPAVVETSAVAVVAYPRLIVEKVRRWMLNALVDSNIFFVERVSGEVVMV